MVYDSPFLLFIAGPPGCGKTTLARSVASRLGAVIVDLDTLVSGYRPIVFTGSDTSNDPTYYRDTIRKVEYRTMYAVAQDNLLVGNTIVCVAPFRQEIGDPSFPSTLADIGVADAVLKRSVGIVIRISSYDLEQNIRSRGITRDSGKLASIEEFLEDMKLAYAQEHWAPQLSIPVQFERSVDWNERAAETVLEIMQRTV